jgi:GNAT superfamily N-acetyltransferase
MITEYCPPADDGNPNSRKGEGKRRIELRRALPQDRLFLRGVYAGVRMDELALTDWDEAKKNAFIDMQFEAQDSYYREVYADADFLVIVEQGRPVGRLSIRCTGEEIRVIDLAVLPAFRNRGIGASLLGDILARASTQGVPVTIHVERMNPALRLYDRLGFVIAEDKGVYLFLRWSPAGMEQEQPQPQS